MGTFLIRNFDFTLLETIKFYNVPALLCTLYMKLNDVAVLHGDWELKFPNFLLILDVLFSLVQDFCYRTPWK